MVGFRSVYGCTKNFTSHPSELEGILSSLGKMMVKPVCLCVFVFDWSPSLAIDIVDDRLLSAGSEIRVRKT